MSKSTKHRENSLLASLSALSEMEQERVRREEELLQHRRELEKLRQEERARQEREAAHRRSVAEAVARARAEAERKANQELEELRQRLAAELAPQPVPPSAIPASGRRFPMPVAAALAAATLGLSAALAAVVLLPPSTVTHTITHSESFNTAPVDVSWSLVPSDTDYAPDTDASVPIREGKRPPKGTHDRTDPKDVDSKEDPCKYSIHPLCGTDLDDRYK